jgi:hypothetical protein
MANSGTKDTKLAPYCSVANATFLAIPLARLSTDGLDHAVLPPSQ